MDLALLVYGISTLENLKVFLGLIMGACAACSLFLVMNSTFISREEEAKYWKWAKRCVVVFCVIGFLQVLLPSQKTAYTMVGAYAAQRVSENEKVQQMSGKVITIIEQKLDGYIDEGLEEARKKLDKK